MKGRYAMFNSLLNASNVSIDSLILDIFIILGVVIAGSLILYFLWEALNAYASKTKTQEKDSLNFEPKETPVEEKKDDLVFTNLEELQKVEESQETTLDEQKLTEVDEIKAEKEQAEAENQNAEEERLNEERRAYLEARRQELIRRMQAEMQQNEEEESTETEESQVTEESENTESEEQTDEVETSEAETDSLEEERNALAQEKARYEAMVKELEEAKRALASAPAPEVVNTTIVKKGALSLDELKERLSATEERLAKTEKEFKQCKKEYLPLRRIWTAHERDEKKLRRKEALVARQKVLLYGVNNFADIDEEKAKKLAEDLDHLDGLKLSVQHCEEVMKENAERYPLLEKMYNVLQQRNEELKKDIAYYNSEIERLESEQND